MKCNHIGIFTLIILGLTLPIQGQNSYFVSVSGSNSNDGSLGKPWQTINYGLGKLFPGDTLNIMSGTYYELVNNFIRSGTPGNLITVRNYAADKPILNGNGQWTVVEFKNRQYYHFKGFEITNAVWSGFNGTNYHHCVVSDCHIHGIGPSSGTAAGLYVSGTPGVADSATYNIIERNMIHDCYGEGIYVGNDGHSLPPDGSNCNGNILRNNEIYRCVDGIDIKTGSKRTTVTGNRIHDCNGAEYSAAIIVFQDAIIDSNYLCNNVNYGIFVQGNWNRITRNLITGNGSYGLHITGYESIWNNYKDSGDDNLAVNNTIASNKNWGIFLWGDATQDSRNTVLRNNIVALNAGYEMVVYAYAGSGLTLDANDWYSGDSDPAIRYSDTDFSTISAFDAIYGKFSNSSMLDPQFSNPNFGDFSLKSASPMIDRGSSAGFRYRGAAPDLGALEFTSMFFPTENPSDDEMVPSLKPALSASIVTDNICTRSWKKYRVILETSSPVVALPAPLILQEKDGSVTRVPVYGSVPGSEFEGELRISKDLAEGPAEFSLETGTLVDGDGNTGSFVRAGSSFVVDKTPPPPPSNARIQ
jgi:hypothetical protein